MAHASIRSTLFAFFNNLISDHKFYRHEFRSRHLVLKSLKYWDRNACLKVILGNLDPKNFPFVQKSLKLFMKSYVPAFSHI